VHQHIHTLFPELKFNHAGAKSIVGGGALAMLKHGAWLPQCFRNVSAPVIHNYIFNSQALQISRIQMCLENQTTYDWKWMRLLISLASLHMHQMKHNCSWVKFSSFATLLFSTQWLMLTR